MACPKGGVVADVVIPTPDYVRFATHVLEIISPGGLEEAFRIIDTAPPDLDLGPVVGPYGCEGDMEATVPIMEKHGLTFG